MTDHTDPRALAVPGTEIVVRVTPNATREQVTLDGARFVIRVTCAPEDGKANRAVTKLLAKALGVPPTRLTLIRGKRGGTRCFGWGDAALVSPPLIRPVGGFALACEWPHRMPINRPPPTRSPAG